MIIDLNSFGRESTVDLQISANEIDLDLINARLVGNVDFAATITKGSAATTVVGRVKSLIEIDCDRCLEPTATSLEIEIDLEFVPVEQFSAEAERELTAEDLNIDAFNGESLDFRAIVREQILLEFPQQHFCENDCKGLCTKCGNNLNLIDCNCNETETDPRWAALKDLR